MYLIERNGYELERQSGVVVSVVNHSATATKPGDFFAVCFLFPRQESVTSNPGYSVVRKHGSEKKLMTPRILLRFLTS